VFFTTIVYGAFMPCMIRLFKSRDSNNNKIENANTNAADSTGSTSLTNTDSTTTDNPTKYKGYENKDTSSIIEGNENSINDFNYNYLNPNYQKE